MICSRRIYRNLNFVFICPTKIYEYVQHFTFSVLVQMFVNYSKKVAGTSEFPHTNNDDENPMSEKLTNQHCFQFPSMNHHKHTKFSTSASTIITHCHSDIGDEIWRTVLLYQGGLLIEDINQC